MKAWPRAVWQEIAAAWRQYATYHQGTRWLFNFTPPVAKTPVSVECHNSSYAGGADVLVKGCKEGGGCVGRRTGGGRMVLLACLCARECCTVAVYCAQSTVWPRVHAKQSSASVFCSSENTTEKRTYDQAGGCSQPAIESSGTALQGINQVKTQAQKLTSLWRRMWGEFCTHAHRAQLLSRGFYCFQWWTWALVFNPEVYPSHIVPLAPLHSTSLKSDTHTCTDRRNTHPSTDAWHDCRVEQWPANHSTAEYKTQ